MAAQPWFIKFKKDWQNKKVLIMGLGLLGKGVEDAALFAEIGAKVTVTDLRPPAVLKPSLKKLKKYQIYFVLGEHRKKDFLNQDMILRNPGVPLNSPFIKIAKEKNIPIQMDDSLFAKYTPTKIIGITGTRGKSTTTMMIYQILKKSGFSVWLGGNIYRGATLNLLKKIKENDLVVMELSSWQLQGFAEAHISPWLAVITNIYPDHLNRYSSMKEYIEDKKAIFKFQKKTDCLFLNKDSSILKSFAKEKKGKIFWFSKNDFPTGWKLKIKGEHNKSNAVAAIAVAKFLKIKEELIKKSIGEFKGLPFRLEKISCLKGVEYINDSASTTPVAGIAALNAFTKPIVLIAGGNSKNLDMSEFAKKIAKKVKAVVFLEGDETENLMNLVKRFGGASKIKGRFDDLKKAVLVAKRIARKNEVILFSPGCTSFGMFNNEFDRGERFNRIVKELD